MNRLVKKTKEFLKLVEKLKKQGYKKKEIAAMLNMPAPVFSSLYKTVLPQIAAINVLIANEETKEKIENAFSLVNNLSKSKIIDSLDDYLIGLKKISKTSKSETPQFDFIKNLKNHAESSFDYVKQNYVGIYYFYYISTDKYCIKRDVFMIKVNQLNKTVECFKGNNKCRVQYYGIVTTIGTHTLSLNMAEKNYPPNEYLLLNMSLPSIRKVEFFRGVFTNLTYARQPIARKFVMVKVSDSTDEYEFDNFDVLYFDNEKSEDISEISEYLQSVDSKTECHLVTSPTFDIHDLKKELKIIKM